MFETTTTRANPLIDPGLQIWHGEVALYLFLGGLAAGLMVLTGLDRRRDPSGPRSTAMSLLPWAAPLVISSGMLFLLLDLERPGNVFRFYATWRLSSPMSWGAWILAAVYPVSILFAWSVTPPETRPAWLRRWPATDRLAGLADWGSARIGALALVNVVTGAALGLYTGILLGAFGARPLWNSAIMGPLFLTSGLSTGAAFLLLFPLQDGERRRLGRLDSGLLGAELLLLTLWMIGLLSGGEASRRAAMLLLGGPYTASFWTLVVTIGLLAPLAAGWLEWRHRARPGRGAALLVLAGGLALRWILVEAGQHSTLVQLVSRAGR